MGAGGAAVAFVLLLVGGVLLVVLCVGLVLLAAYGIARLRGHRPTAVLVSGLVCVGLVFAVPAGTVTWAAMWGRVTGDPETLRLDLRTPVAASSLPGEESPGLPGSYEFTSDTVELRLPGHRSLKSEVDTVGAYTKDGYVESVSFDGEYEPAAQAVERLRGWAAQLDVAPGHVHVPRMHDQGGFYTGGHWSNSVETRDLTVGLDLNARDGGEWARVGMSIQLK